MNRPHKSLKLDVVLEGVKEFTKMFDGKVVSETMVINNINYNIEFEKNSRFSRESG